MKKLIFLIAMLLLASSANAVILFGHGGTENIDYTIDDTIYVDSQLSPDPGTIINVISGGNVTSEYIRLYNNSSINVDGGKVAGIWAHNNSTVNIYDGEVNWYIALSGNAKLNIYGGIIHQKISAGDNMVEIWGGQLLGDITTYDGPVKLYGLFDQGYGTFAGNGSITGTLSNGNLINVDYSTYNSGSIILAPVPEPTIVSLLAIGGLIIRKRK